MKMILDHPQVPGSGGSVVDAKTGVQAIKLRREGYYVLNTGDENLISDAKRLRAASFKVIH
jgi:hypothetical protein